LNVLPFTPLTAALANNPTIKQSNNPTIQQSNNQTIQQSNHPTIKQSNNPTIKQSNNPPMFQNSIKLTLRSLWRNRLFTALHVAGLAIGLSAAWLVWQYVDFEQSHNRQIPNAENIYRVVSYFKGADGNVGQNSGCPQPLWKVAEEVPGIESSVPIHSVWIFSIWPEGAKNSFREVNQVARTTSDYFSIVPGQWLAGSAATALAQPNEVVLARSRAERYFPRHSPEEMLGKTLRYVTFQDTLQVKVAGVVEDLDFPTSFIEKELLSIGEPEEDNWGGVNSNHQLWLSLRKDADPASVLAAINKVSDEKGGSKLKTYNLSRWHELQALPSVHFADRFGSHIRAANRQGLKVLGAVALFLLLLATINYINLSTARIPTRAREIGIRKALGGQRRGIIGSFLLETFLICGMAALLAGVITDFAFGFFKDDLPEDVLKFTDWRRTAVFLFGMVTALSLLAGLYPAWLASRFQAVSLLRGDFAGQRQGRSSNGNLRRGLIVFQFFIAQVFIIGALVVGKQLHFMRSADLGFDRQAVLTIEAPREAWRDTALLAKLPLVAQQLRQLPEIQQVAFGDPPLSNSYSSNTHTRMDDKGTKLNLDIYRKNVDGQLPALYRLNLLAGRFLTDADSSNRYVITETASKAFGFETPQAAIGQFVGEIQGEGKPDDPRQIVGVVADFHSLGFQAELQPIALIHDASNISTLNVRLASTRPTDWQPALKKMGAIWQDAYPGEAFSPTFYDETIADIYQADITLAKFTNLATAIAIFISCLGLFGLATFMSLRRTKEISIRKVLGASAASVVGLLSKEFVALVLGGFVLAVPLAFYFLKKWLDNYAYRIELSWWIFAVAGLAAVLIAFVTVSFQSIKAALANPVESLRSE
jgi:ABC-type antimicrobial peptide transport system permease subunit